MNFDIYYKKKLPIKQLVVFITFLNLYLFKNDVAYNSISIGISNL